MGSIEIEDYTNAPFMLEYKGPYYLLYDGCDIISLEKDHIIIYK